MTSPAPPTPVYIPASPDVVVVGGGTAGATAAHLLARWGHAVLVIERGGGRAPLAESIPPSCIPLLEVAGVRERMDAAGFVRGSGNTVWWKGEPQRVEYFPGGRLGYQVQREALEGVLAGAAVDAGATFVRPGIVRSVAPVDSGHDVTFDLASGLRTVRTPWVLDCSGRAGVLARGRRGDRTEHGTVPHGARTTALIGIWEQDSGWGVPDESHTLVESAEWGWGWSVPVTHGRRFVTAMVDPAHTSLRGTTPLVERYGALIAALPALGALVRDARFAAGPWGVDATPYRRHPVAEAGLLLVGDAASAIDPLSSFGVKKALASAWLAAVVVHTALVTPRHTSDALSLFAAREAAYVARASQAFGALSRETGDGGAVPFWSTRGGEGGAGDESGDAPIDRLRDDPEVLAAFRELRERPVLRLVPSPALRRERCPVVRGNVVIAEDHLVLRDVPEPVRYLRSVDLLAILDLAPHHDDIGAMYAHYTRQLGPVALPDFLGAVSVLVAKGGASLA